MFRKMKMSDIGEIIAGGTPKTKVDEYWNGSVPWITPKDLSSSEGRFISKGERNISEDGLKNSSAKLLPKGTVLFTSRAPIGYIAISENEVTTNQGFKNIVVNEKNHNIFVYYLLKNNVEYIKSLANGSTFMEVSGSVMKNIELKIPSLQEQISIANILSTLDEKIEVNNQINKTLENMAQAIFTRWFVDFEFPNEDGEPYKSSGGEMVESELGMIPKGWEVVKLSEIANITMGQSPKGSSFNEMGEGTVFYQGRTDFTKRFPERRLFTTEPNRMAKKGDILMSVRAPVGDINIADEDCCIGRGLCAIRSNNYVDSFMLYLLFQLKQKLDVFNGEGTVFGSINKDNLCGMDVISADARVIEKYEETVSKSDKQYSVLESESRVLTKLRDTLLPKLMSGEIRILFDSIGSKS